MEFDLDGERFTALNGGPMFKFTEAVSFVVHCKDQADVDSIGTRSPATAARRVSAVG